MIQTEQSPPEVPANDVGPTSRECFDAFLWASEDGSFVNVVLNETLLWVPVDTIRTMVHCLSLTSSGQLRIDVESAHLKWMMHKLREGGTFLDVGAATGATTLPIAVHLRDLVQVVSYEPARLARELLVATLERNAIIGVTVRPVAVSEAAGQAEFREYLPDPTGRTPFLPEASSIVSTSMSDAPHATFTVPVVTLDQDALWVIQRKPVVCKIDVEGFEALVLRGASALLALRSIYLSIDLHVDPFGDGTRSTEREVRSILEKYGYTFEAMGHVLLCSPPA
jgi:FkbM family methyltransferase